MSPFPGMDPYLEDDWAAVFRSTYTRGRYAASIDYTQPPPGVPDAGRAWIASRRR